jgi:ribosomal protein S15P/S13E
MSRLGAVDESTSIRRRDRNPAFGRIPKVNIRNVALLFIGIFILRNLLRNDYRSEEMKYLKDSGMSPEEIEKYVPKTAEERRQYVASKQNDMTNMKKDIAFLLQEVNDLKGHLKGTAGGNARDIGLKEMDHVHEVKRKAHEEQLLKDHPDFKPTRNKLRKAVE